MQGINETRKYRKFPWKRKHTSIKRFQKKIRSLNYKHGKVWTNTAHQQIHNLCKEMNFNFKRLMESYKDGRRYNEWRTPSGDDGEATAPTT